MSLDIIRQRRYNSLVAFDRDMSSLFERARRYHPEGSLEYGYVIVLQRLYNALTAPYPMPLPPSGVPAPSPTKFASLPAGPGTARPVHEITQDLKAGVAEGDVGIGITTFRVGNKDRIFTDEARHKGMAYKTGEFCCEPFKLTLGDYIHLINPDDAARPIVGQIFRTFVPTKGFKTHHVTVCWYFRPEQVSTSD
jgi:chromatin structure-remodeling complex subunit RSC1/2